MIRKRFAQTAASRNTAAAERNRLVGCRIRNIREERGLTQLDLAELSGLSRASIGNIETGRQSPMPMLIPIAKALNIDPGRLLP